MSNEFIVGIFTQIIRSEKIYDGLMIPTANHRLISVCMSPIYIVHSYTNCFCPKEFLSQDNPSTHLITIRSWFWHSVDYIHFDKFNSSGQPGCLAYLYWEWLHGLPTKPVAQAKATCSTLWLHLDKGAGLQKTSVIYKHDYKFGLCVQQATCLRDAMSTFTKQQNRYL